MSRRLALPWVVLVVLAHVVAARAFLVQTAEEDGEIVRAAWDRDEVGFRLDAVGSDDLDPAVTLRILRQSFAAWDTVSGSRLRLRDDGTVSGRSPSRRDGINLVVFDETGDQLGAPAGSGIIAVTRLQSRARSGTIVDADIIFNGRDFRFAATPTPGRVVLADVAVHEIGHFVGLEHTPLGGDPAVRPTMNPFYFGDGAGEASTLEADDIAGLCSLYPTAAWLSTTGRVEGHVHTLDGDGVFGAHVIAEALSGGTRVSTLSGAHTGSADPGAYRVTGLPPGRYRVRLEPVGHGIDESNFSGLFDTLATGFPAELYPNAADVTDAEAVVVDAVTLRATGVDFVTGFVNPGEPYIVAVDAPGNTPDVLGPYRLAFDIANAASADLVVDTGDGTSVVAMTRGAGDRFDAVLPGQPAGTRVRYRVRAVSDEGLSAALPADGGWSAFDIITLSAAPLAFAILRDEGSLAVFDADDGAEVARLAVGQDPIQLLPGRDGRWLYASDLAGDAVAVIDATTFRVVDRIAVDAQPLDLALSPDGATLYVTNSGAGGLSVIDTASRRVVDVVPLGLGQDGPYGIAAADAAVYVTDLRDDAVLVVADGAVRRRIAVAGGPRSLALTPDGERLLVASFGGADLTVIDTATDTVTAVVPLGIEGAFAVAVHPAGHTAWVTAHADAAVVAVDLQALRVRATIPVGADPRGLSLSPVGDRLFVSVTGDDEIHVLDADEDRAVDVLAADGGPRGIQVLAPLGHDAVSDEADALPQAWSLSPAWPNPFNAGTSVALHWPAGAEGPVRLAVYDLLGQRLRRLAGPTAPGPGRHVVQWDGRDDEGRRAASGVYLLTASTRAGWVAARKVLLLR